MKKTRNEEEQLGVMEVERTVAEKRELTEFGGESKTAEAESEKEGGGPPKMKITRIVEKIRTQEGKEMKRTEGRVNAMGKCELLEEVAESWAWK